MFCNMSVSCFNDLISTFVQIRLSLLYSVKCHNKVYFKNQPVIDHLKIKHSQSNQDSAMKIIVSWSSSISRLLELEQSRDGRAIF